MELIKITFEKPEYKIYTVTKLLFFSTAKYYAENENPWH